MGKLAQPAGPPTGPTYLGVMTEMPKMARALEIVAAGEFRVIEVPVPEPAEDEVLIAVRACATCTNWELKTWKGIDIFGRAGHPIYPQNPGSPGHEAAGVVVARGAAITDLNEGDHVAVYGSRRGPENDAHVEFITRPASEVTKLDPAISFADAAPLEMGLCVVRSLDMAGDLHGKHVGVVGLGPAGLLHLQLARARGAASCVGLDVVPRRLEIARRFAERVVDGRDADAVAHAIADGVEACFECSGNPVGMRTALDLARRIVHVFAVPESEVPWRKADWLRGVSLVPYDWRQGTQTDCLRRAAALLAAGALDTRAIVTHVLPYSRYAEGLGLLESREATKIVFQGWD